MSASRRGGSGLRISDVIVLVIVGVFAVVVAFWLLSFIAGFLFGILKLALIIVAIAAVLWFLIGRRR
jgi:hypothetical protein